MWSILACSVNLFALISCVYSCSTLLSHLIFNSLRKNEITLPNLEIQLIVKRKCELNDGFHVSIGQLQSKIIILAIYYFNKRMSSLYSSMRNDTKLLEIFVDVGNMRPCITEYSGKFTSVLYSFTSVLHYFLWIKCEFEGLNDGLLM